MIERGLSKTRGLLHQLLMLQHLVRWIIELHQRCFVPVRDFWPSSFYKVLKISSARNFSIVLQDAVRVPLQLFYLYQIFSFLMQFSFPSPCWTSLHHMRSAEVSTCQGTSAMKKSPIICLFNKLIRLTSVSLSELPAQPCTYW